MYQSLHTSVIGEDGNTFEIQIRTEEMDSLLNLGLLLIGVIKKAKVILPKQNKKKLEKNLNGYENLFLCQMISKMAMPKNIMTPFFVIFLKPMFMF